MSMNAFNTLEQQQPRDVNLELELEGPGVYVFYCEETRCSFHGHLAAVKKHHQGDAVDVD